MNDIIERLAAAAREFQELDKLCRLCGIDGNVHLNADEYKTLFPDYRDHTIKKHGGFLRVSHDRDGIEFFCLCDPDIKVATLRDMI